LAGSSPNPARTAFLPPGFHLVRSPAFKWSGSEAVPCMVKALDKERLRYSSCHHRSVLEYRRVDHHQ
jgi:hypothetical protein